MNRTCDPDAPARAAIIGFLVGVGVPTAGLVLLYLVGRFGLPPP